MTHVSPCQRTRTFCSAGEHFLLFSSTTAWNGPIHRPTMWQATRVYRGSSAQRKNKISNKHCRFNIQAFTNLLGFPLLPILRTLSHSSHINHSQCQLHAILLTRPRTNPYQPSNYFCHQNPSSHSPCGAHSFSPRVETNSILSDPICSPTLFLFWLFYALHCYSDYLCHSNHTFHILHLMLIHIFSLIILMIQAWVSHSTVCALLPNTDTSMNLDVILCSAHTSKLYTHSFLIHFLVSVPRPFHILVILWQLRSQLLITKKQLS